MTVQPLSSSSVRSSWCSPPGRRPTVCPSVYPRGWGADPSLACRRGRAARTAGASGRVTGLLTRCSGRPVLCGPLLMLRLGGPNRALRTRGEARDACSSRSQSAMQRIRQAADLPDRGREFGGGPGRSRVRSSSLSLRRTVRPSPRLWRALRAAYGRKGRHGTSGRHCSSASRAGRDRGECDQGLCVAAARSSGSTSPSRLQAPTANSRRAAATSPADNRRAGAAHAGTGADKTPAPGATPAASTLRPGRSTPGLFPRRPAPRTGAASTLRPAGPCGKGARRGHPALPGPQPPNPSWCRGG